MSRVACFQACIEFQFYREMMSLPGGASLSLVPGGSSSAQTQHVTSEHAQNRLASSSTTHAPDSHQQKLSSAAVAAADLMPQPRFTAQGTGTQTHTGRSVAFTN